MRLSTYPHFLAYYLGGTAMRRQLREQSHEPEEEPGAKARAFEVAEQSIQKALQKLKRPRNDLIAKPTVESFLFALVTSLGR